MIGFPDAGPVLDRLRFAPPQVADGRLSERDAFENRDAGMGDAFDDAVCRFCFADDLP